MLFTKGTVKKRANLKDIPDSVFILFSVVFTIFIISATLDEFETKILQNNATNFSQVTSDLSTHKTRFVSGWDYGFLFLVLALPVFSFLAARKIPINSTAVVFTFIMLGFFVVFGFIVSNMHGIALDNATYAAFINGTIFIKLLMPLLPYYTLFYIPIVMIGLFSKEGQQ